ncbi:MAG: glycosyltransferase family 4 protein [Candidatus Bathyarchaeia archaeon]
MIAERYPPYVGGAPYCIHQMARGLSRLGHEIIVVTCSAPNAPEYEDVNGIEIRRIPYWDFPRLKGVSFIINALRKRRQLMREVHPDIIHAHSGISGVIGYSYKKATLCPLILTFHGLVFPDKLTSKISLRIDRYVTHHADYITFDSSPMQEHFVREFDLERGKTCYIPNAVDTDLFKPVDVDRKAWGIGERDICLVYVGRLVKMKGLQILLESFKEANREVETLKLLIVGDGPLREELVEKTRRYGLVNQVLFLSSIPPNELPLIYAASDMAVLPSAYEGLSRMLLEAMACGKAVIASDIPANRELITNGQDGLLVTPLDSVSLKEAIIKLALNRELRESFGKMAREKISSKYSVAYRITRILDVYQKVLTT